MLLALLGACAGGGPAPTPATDATVADTLSSEDTPAPLGVDPSVARRARADSLFDAASYDAALPELEACRADTPDDYRLDLRVAWIYFNRGDYDDAVTVYRDAVDANPKSVDALVGLAKAYDQAGQPDSAIRAYARAIDVHGLDVRVAPLVLAQANLLNQKGRYDRSVELIETARAAFELTAGLQCAYGMALAGEGRYDEAIEAFSAATGDAQYADFAYAQIRRVRALGAR